MAAVKTKMRKKITIEVSERLMDHYHKPEIVGFQFMGMRDVPAYHAQIKGKPGFWGCGESRNEAIGSLISSHPEVFSMVIKHFDKMPR